MIESEVQTDIRLAASESNIILMRNNSGAAKETDKFGKTRYIRYGLGNDSQSLNRQVKSSDLIGITPVVITPEHVGMTIGVFTAYEVKRAGWKYTGNAREKAQKAFMDIVLSLGGIAKFVTSRKDLVTTITDKT